MQAAADSSAGVRRIRELQAVADGARSAVAQRVATDDADAVFPGGAVIDNTQALVVRADRVFTPSNAVLETFQGNADKKLVGKKNAVTWKAGTMTGQSVMATFSALPEGKKQSVVKSVPAGLEIVQCNNANHAELRTTVEMSNKQIADALKQVVLSDKWDGEVAQLRR
jgi:hypothetical protein